MKMSIIGPLLFGLCMTGCSHEERRLPERTFFCSISEARRLITTEDAFTHSWSRFDINSRLKKTTGSRKELFGYIASQVREWSDEEKHNINNAIQKIDERLRALDLNIPFPDSIFLIKTTGDEEGGANGYTRGTCIILKEAVATRPDEGLQKVITHELFHVLSRNDPEFRKAMYANIGFQMMEPVPYPDSLKDLRITNPDAPQTDNYIEIVKDQTAFPCMMVLYAYRPYLGGDFFDYLQFGLLRLRGIDHKEVDLVGGKPIIYKVEEVSNFFEQVGRNTQYIIHPEEILADNFTSVVFGEPGLPSPGVIEKITGTMKARLK